MITDTGFVPTPHPSGAWNLDPWQPAQQPAPRPLRVVPPRWAMALLTGVAVLSGALFSLGVAVVL